MMASKRPPMSTVMSEEALDFLEVVAMRKRITRGALVRNAIGKLLSRSTPPRPNELRRVRAARAKRGRG